MDDRIRKHYAHEVVVSQYTDETGVPYNFAIECLDCYEIILDEEAWGQVNA